MPGDPTLNGVQGHYRVASNTLARNNPESRGITNPAFSLDERGSEQTGCERQVSLTEGGDAIVIRDGEKAYKPGEPVLENFNMTVPCGSIYGLLGASGCGKTTVLSAIVGLRPLDHGKIWIFGKPPGTRSTGIPGKNIGYMPQDASLYSEFSVSETLNYFGTLAGMNSEEIEKTKKVLVSLLDLPNDSRRADKLSGGQQRRLSFAAALMHSPELLILDEPTVGVDPLVRQNIWSYLEKLVRNERATVIITTHYIEECRQADNVGIMRNGRLVSEKPPQMLMIEYGSNNLEKAVLALSKKQGSIETCNEPKEREMAKKNQQFGGGGGDVETQTDDKLGRNILAGVKMATVKKEPTTSLRDTVFHIRALVVKNYVILFRNPLLLFYVLFMAALILILVCSCVGPDPRHLRVGFVNLELDYEKICPNFTRVDGECNVENLSCEYLQSLNNGSIDLVPFRSEEDALKAVQSADTWGYILFQQNFSNAFFQRYNSRGHAVDEQTFNKSQIIVRLDESSKQIAVALKKSLHDGFEDFIGIVLSDCGFDQRHGKSIFIYDTPIFGKNDTDFLEFISPGTALSLIFFTPIITTSVRYIREKKTGVLQRAVVGGVKMWEIMVACSISEFFLLVIQSLLCYLVLTQLFKISVLGSHFLLIVLFVLSGYGGVSMGFMLGAVCSEEIQAAILTMAAFFPNFILTGILWPLEGMGDVLQNIVKGLPVTYAGEAVRSITSRGWDLTHPNVWPGLAVLLGYNMGYFLLTVLIFILLKK